MTFQAFQTSTEFTEPGRWYVVSCDDAQYHVLQWEPSNQKWYEPKPVWGRKEVGYMDTIAMLSSSAKVVHIRPLNWENKE